MKNITFVNAGAGSGKTYRLTTDLARILTQDGVEPSQVILTTFTKLAASEFREKARREILNAKDESGQPINSSVRIKCATQLDNVNSSFGILKSIFVILFENPSIYKALPLTPFFINGSDASLKI